MVSPETLFAGIFTGVMGQLIVAIARYLHNRAHKNEMLVEAQKHTEYLKILVTLAQRAFDDNQPQG